MPAPRVSNPNQVYDLWSTPFVQWIIKNWQGGGTLPYLTPPSYTARSPESMVPPNAPRAAAPPPTPFTNPNAVSAQTVQARGQTPWSPTPELGQMGAGAAALGAAGALPNKGAGIGGGGQAPKKQPVAADPLKRYKDFASWNGVNWDVLQKYYMPQYGNDLKNIGNAVAHAVSDGIFAKVANKYNVEVNDVVWNEYATAMGNRPVFDMGYQELITRLNNSPLRGHPQAINDFIEMRYNTQIVEKAPEAQTKEQAPAAEQTTEPFSTPTQEQLAQNPEQTPSEQGEVPWYQEQPWY